MSDAIVTCAVCHRRYVDSRMCPWCVIEVLKAALPDVDEEIDTTAIEDHLNDAIAEVERLSDVIGHPAERSRPLKIALRDADEALEMSRRAVCVPRTWKERTT